MRSEREERHTPLGVQWGMADERPWRVEISRHERRSGPGPGGDQNDHVIMVPPVVQTPDPGGIRRTRIGERSQNGDGKHQNERAENENPVLLHDSRRAYLTRVDGSASRRQTREIAP